MEQIKYNSNKGCLNGGQWGSMKKKKPSDIMLNYYNVLC